MAKKILLLLFAFLIFSAVSALGITPSREELPYEPGSSHVLVFTILGDEGQYVDVRIEGELQNYTQLLSEKNFTLENGAHNIAVNFTIPYDLAPGLHQALVGGQEGAPPSIAGGVSARVAVLSQIWVRVPYPEKYADMKFEPPKRIASGDVLHLVVELANRGLPISLASGSIEILDSQDNSIAVLPLVSEQNIMFGETRNLVTDWPTIGVRAGNYKAIARVNYDEKSIVSLPQGIVVGEIFIDIININASKVLKGAIAKIPIEIQSKWNDKLPDVYAKIKISRNGANVAELQSASIDVNSWSTANLEAFWDTSNLDNGDYDAKVSVIYANKVTEKNKILRIVDSLEEESGFALTPDMIVLIVMVAGIIILALAYNQKRRKRYYYNYYGWR